MFVTRRLAASTLLWHIAHGQINNNASPLPVAFNNVESVGPDGPWWYMDIAFDYPDQFVPLLPSLSQNTLVVNSTACTPQNANCPLPIPNLWSWSGADQVAGANRTISPEHPPTTNDMTQGTLMRMQGAGTWFSERLTWYPDGNPDVGLIMGYLVVGSSNSYSVTYPGGKSYTLDTGFLSLYGGEQLFSWDDPNGFNWTNNHTLPDTYALGYIPSTSYGLHVGSVYPNVTGSLVLGGYDSSRVISDPLTSDSNTVTLTGIALNVSAGNSAYMKSTSSLITGLLQNGGSTDSLDVNPDPGVPYLYLPQDTCDAIAAHLPVTYNKDFNLYFWNTDDSAYEKIVSSPHYLSFNFSGSGSTTATINVPFALLNLTLDTTLVNPAVQYFPCSPWEPTGGVGYYLGRSFLQAAFLGQNWNSSTMFLAQAPGPDFMSRNLKTIAYTDTTLAPASAPPSWESTWEGTLKALSGSSSNGTSSSGSSSHNGNSKGSGLSGGAIAGIVVGVVAGLALVGAAAWFFLRKRKHQTASRNQEHQDHQQQEYQLLQKNQAGSYRDSSPNPPYHDAGTKEQPYTYNHTPPAEVSGQSAVAELPSTRPTYELDAGQDHPGAHKRP